MAVQRWRIVNAQGVVENVIMLDRDTNPDWQPPPGRTLRLDDGTAVNLPRPVDQPATAEEKLAAAVAVLDAVTALDAPVLAADVVDALADLRTALGGQ